MRELYVIEFESANYAGAGDTCLVWATSEEDARLEFEETGWGEEVYREQDEYQYFDEYGEDTGVVWSTFVSATKLAGSRYEKWVADPKQKQFYQIVNE